MELNEKVVNALEKGQIKEILLGVGKYFLPDSTFRDSHDVMLVIFVLLQWIKNKKFSIDFLNSVEDALLNIANTNPWECIDILLAYTITAKDNKLCMPVNFSSIFSILRNHLNSSREDQGTRNAEKTLEDLKRRFRLIDIELGN